VIPNQRNITYTEDRQPKRKLLSYDYMWYCTIANNFEEQVVSILGVEKQLAQSTCSHLADYMEPYLRAYSLLSGPEISDINNTPVVTSASTKQSLVVPCLV
jgi:hypothetical protein